MSAVETYNVPLSDMTVQDLECLLVSVRQALDEREEEATVNRRKKLKESGKLKEYKEEFKALKKEAKALTGKRTYELVLPITFTVEGELLDDYDYVWNDLLDYSDVYWNDFMSFHVSGKLTGDFNKAQKRVVQESLDVVLEDACEDFMLLFPDLVAQRDAFEKRAKALCHKLNDAEVKFEDL
jgi:hypothetical protein